MAYESAHDDFLILVFNTTVYMEYLYSHEVILNYWVKTISQKLLAFEETVLKEGFDKFGLRLRWLENIVKECFWKARSYLINEFYLNPEGQKHITLSLLIGSWNDVIKLVDESKKIGFLFILGVKRSDNEIIKIVREHPDYKEEKFVADGEWIIFNGEAFPIFEIHLLRSYWKKYAWTVIPEDTKVLALWVYHRYISIGGDP